MENCRSVLFIHCQMRRTTFSSFEIPVYIGPPCSTKEKKSLYVTVKKFSFLSISNTEKNIIGFQNNQLKLIFRQLTKCLRL